MFGFVLGLILGIVHGFVYEFSHYTILNDYVYLLKWNIDWEPLLQGISGYSFAEVLWLQKDVPMCIILVYPIGILLTSNAVPFLLPLLK